MERGDIYYVSLGRESGDASPRRFVFIVSPREFNYLVAPLVCPIKDGGDAARHRGFAVPLGNATRTQGLVLCNQPRLLDIALRQSRFVEKAPLPVVDEVIARLSTLLQ